MNLFIVSSPPGTGQLLLYILILLCILVHFWQTSEGSFEKQPSLAPHLHNKLPYKSLPAHDATLHWISSQTELRWMIEVELSWISSARLRDQSGWRQTVSKTGPEVKLCLGLTLFCVRGKRLLCLVCFTLQNMHCLQLMHCIPQLSPSLYLLVAAFNIVELLLVC